MHQTQPETPISGFLLVDKPIDWTSHDVVGYLRKITGIKKIGHAGTLDPFASGLLIVAIGRQATKRIDEFKAQEKSYTATIQLGATSNTQDGTGTIEEASEDQKQHLTTLTQEQIEEVLDSFVGPQEQIPPMFSAKKVKGKKLYELARKGVEIERKPVAITIHSLSLQNYDTEKNIITIDCSVSTGTYIRTLAHDIGQTLGVGAYCQTLRRTSIGPYLVTDAMKPKNLSSDTWESRLVEIA